MTRRLRLAPEWGCYPLWDHATGDNLPTESLGLPPDLARRIEDWDGRFQAALDQNYPPDSRFASEAEETAWIAEGRAIAAELRALLGADAIIERTAGLGFR